MTHYRFEEPAESIEIRAWKAECRYCEGLVKVLRDRGTLEVDPNTCSCLQCGQKYKPIIPSNMSFDDWQIKQWNEKTYE